MFYKFYYNNKDYQIEMNETAGLRIEVYPRPSSVEQLVEIQIAFLKKFQDGQVKAQISKTEPKIEVETLQVEPRPEILRSSILPVAIDVEKINMPVLGKLFSLIFALTTAWAVINWAIMMGNLPTLTLTLLFFAGCFWLYKQKSSSFDQNTIETEKPAKIEIKQLKPELPKFVGKKSWTEIELFFDKDNQRKLFNYQNTYAGMEKFLKNAGYKITDLDLTSDRVDLNKK